MKMLLTICLAPVVASLCPLDAAQPGQKLWEFQTGGYVESSPAIGADGTVYVGSFDNKVYALNGATGQKRWEFRTGGYVQSSPAIGADGTVYVGSGDKKVYALNGATGQKRWEFQTGGEVRSSLAIGAEGTVYVGSYDTKVYALNGATGQKLWEFQTGDSVHSSPAIGADGRVYVGSVDTKVYALNGATGQKLWEFQTGTGVYSSPAIGADGTVYVGSPWGLVYALNGATGQMRWEFPVMGNVCSSPALGADGTVYVGTAESPTAGAWTVYALNGTSGQERWEFRTGYDVRSCPALGADGTVYVGSDKLYALNGATGQKLWEFQTGSLEWSPPAIAADGTVYVGSGVKVYALCSSSVGGLAQSPWPKFHANAQNTGRCGQPPAIAKQLGLAVLKEGQEARLTVQVSGDPAPQVQWFFNGAALPGDTNATLILPAVTRALEGTYLLVASNTAGQATSAPIAAVVSNVDPERFVALHWPGHADSGLALESTDRLGPGAVWHTLSNYPSATTEQRFVELEPAAAGFYRLSGSGSPPVFTGNGFVNGWRYAALAGTQHRIEYTAASTGWTNWLVLTNLVLPASPYLFLDYDSLGAPARLYRTTPVP
jgi:outer membrane protein assembly factor BamB